jgi:hypothetical protein
MDMTPITSNTTVRRWARFAWHYVEMVIAMFAGMIILGFARSAVGLDFTYQNDPEIASLLMAFDMSIGMAAWMRFRGHRWPVTLEMCGAMFVPLVPCFPLLWLGLIDGGALMLVSHVAMFPAMLAVMLMRLDEYAGCAR